MENRIIATGDLTRFNKLVRKKGINSITEYETFQVRFANSSYDRFDLLTEWICRIVSAGLWENLKSSTRISVQAAPFRSVKDIKIKPNRLSKLVSILLKDHAQKRTTSICQWLPWFILYTEKVDKRFADQLDDAVFCLLFYEALDFAFRAEGVNAARFNHMFNTDNMTIVVRSRYLAYCTYCIDNHPSKVGKIQFMENMTYDGEGLCEIPPILLACHLGQETLASSIMTYMDDDYLANLRLNFLDSIAKGASKAPLYIFTEHKKFLNEKSSRDVKAYEFSRDEVCILYKHRDIIRFVAERQPDLITAEDLLFHYKIASENLEGDFVRRVLAREPNHVWNWLKEHPIDEGGSVACLAEYMPTPFPSDVLSRVLFEFPIRMKYIRLAKSFHVHPESVYSYLLYILELCASNDHLNLLELFSKTKSLPCTFYSGNMAYSTWRSVTSRRPRNLVINKDKEDAIIDNKNTTNTNTSLRNENKWVLKMYDNHEFEKALAVFFDKSIYKLLKKEIIKEETWRVLCIHSPPTILHYKPSYKRRITWDVILMKTQKEPSRYVTHFWKRFPLGSYPHSAMKGRKRNITKYWNPLACVFASSSGIHVEQAAKIWDIALTYSPDMFCKIGDRYQTPLHIALKKKGMEWWIQEKLDDFNKQTI